MFIENKHKVRQFRRCCVLVAIQQEAPMEPCFYTLHLFYKHEAPTELNEDATVRHLALID